MNRRRNRPITPVVIGGLLLAGIALAASSSKPKEIVVVGSKIRELDGRAIGRYYAKAAKRAAAARPAPEVQMQTAYTLIDTVRLGPSGKPNSVEIELFEKGRRVHKLTAELRCELPEQAVKTKPLFAFYVEDLGFEPGTPILMAKAAKGDEIRIGPVSGKAGRCTVIGLLLPAVQAAREAARAHPRQN
jgi:hypothetical protein